MIISSLNSIIYSSYIARNNLHVALLHQHIPNLYDSETNPNTSTINAINIDYYK